MESFHSEFHGSTHTQLVTRSGEILTEPRGQRRHELTTDIDLVKILAIFWKEILKRFHEIGSCGRNLILLFQTFISEETDCFGDYFVFIRRRASQWGIKGSLLYSECIINIG